MVNSMVNSNVATIILAGNEIKIEFGSGYSYYQITNKGDTDIYASMSPNITPESDGVYTVSAGCSEIIGEGYPFAAFYLLGTGKAYIRGKRNAMPASFKLRGKGGDPSGGGLKTKIVTALPEVGNIEYLYLVPKDDLLSNNIYDEYLWVDGKWELIGDTAIEVDFTDYATVNDLTSHTNNKNNPHEVKPAQIKKDDFVLHRGKTVAELKNELLEWWNSACGTLSVYRFSGGTVSWWLENFKNDEEIIPAGATYTVIPIADYAPDKRHATFLFSAASNSDKSNEILKLELFNSKFVYLSKLVDGVTGIKGEAETEYRTGDINISQANIGLIFDGSVLKNKTVGEAKEIISGTYLSNPDRFGIFMRVPSDLIEKWDDDDYVLSAGSVCQITPIGTVTKASNTGKLYGRFLITAYFGESPYIFDVSASAFGKINKILTSLDITPEMLEKLKNL